MRIRGEFGIRINVHDFVAAETVVAGLGAFRAWTMDFDRQVVIYNAGLSITAGRWVKAFRSGGVWVVMMAGCP